MAIPLSRLRGSPRIEAELAWWHRVKGGSGGYIVADPQPLRRAVSGVPGSRHGGGRLAHAGGADPFDLVCVSRRWHGIETKVNRCSARTREVLDMRFTPREWPAEMTRELGAFAGIASVTVRLLNYLETDVRNSEHVHDIGTSVQFDTSARVAWLCGAILRNDPRVAQVGSEAWRLYSAAIAEYVR